jgi:lysophospholipid acyltransferase (LPLAT)-like uncharacterized protein
VAPRTEAGEPEAGAARSRPWRARLVALVWSLAFRFQLASWRKEVHGLENLDGLIARGVPVLGAFWHGKYTPLFALLRGRRAVIFTSLSFRGGVIADICRRFGYRPAQIPDRGGEESLERMRRELAGAKVCGIAVDGPLGPYHLVKRGPVRLASELGFQVVPITFAARRSRVAAERWDRMELPRLFTRVVFLVGEAIEVPPGLDAEGVEAWAARLREVLEDLDRRAAELV